MKVLGIVYSRIQQGAYMLVLAQEGTMRRIPIVIGAAEAQSIAIRLENLVPPRPMTHDLFCQFCPCFWHTFNRGIHLSVFRRNILFGITF